MQTSLSSLQNTMPMDLASRLYTMLNNLSAPRFAYRRLHLPCIAFRVTEIGPQHGQAQERPFTYEVKADGLRDLVINTEDKLIQFSPARHIRQKFWLVRPWNHDLLELPDSTDVTQTKDNYSKSLLHSLPAGSPGENGLVDWESHEHALRMIVRLGQPFGALLLAQQRGVGYKRIASDYHIIPQVKDITSFDNIDIETLEIL